MCTRHSFLMDKEGRIYDGRGLTHSHTEIAVLHDFPGVGVSLSGNAVVIDRMGGGITIFCAGPVEVCGW